jgi:SPP1 gp7 family putative phage head morphogenesis protein
MSELERLLKQGENSADRITKQTERRLIKNYQYSLKEIRAKLSKLAEQGVLTQVEITKYNRLHKLEKEIGEETATLTGKNASNLRKGIGDVFEDQYYRTGFAVEKEAQALLGFGKLDREAVKAAIENPLDNIGFLERNRENATRLRRQLREQLGQGLTQGEGYEKIARRLKERMDVGASEAIRIAQTECHRSQSQGRLKGFEQAEKAGVQARRVWVATLDGRTRDSHAAMDGKYANDEGMFEIAGVEARGPGLTGIASEDINCRCVVRMEIAGYEPKVRRKRGEGNIPYRTYDEYLDKRVRK